MPEYIEVTATWNKLVEMEANGHVVFAAPGAEVVYWASDPNEKDDEQVAVVDNFYDKDGREYDWRYFVEGKFTATVQLVPAKESNDD